MTIHGINPPPTALGPELASELSIDLLEDLTNSLVEDSGLEPDVYRQHEIIGHLGASAVFMHIQRKASEHGPAKEVAGVSIGRTEGTKLLQLIFEGAKKPEFSDSILGLLEVNCILGTLLEMPDLQTADRSLLMHLGNMAGLAAGCEPTAHQLAVMSCSETGASQAVVNVIRGQVAGNSTGAIHSYSFSIDVDTDRVLGIEKNDYHPDFDTGDPELTGIPSMELPLLRIELGDTKTGEIVIYNSDPESGRETYRCSNVSFAEEDDTGAFDPDAIDSFAAELSQLEDSLEIEGNIDPPKHDDVRQLTRALLKVRLLV